YTSSFFISLFFFLLLRRPPISTLFPYTTLFRSQTEIENLYHNEQAVLAIIYLDNYEEITQNMDDTSKTQLNSKVTAVLNNWSHAYGIYLKRTSQDRFIAVGTKEILDKL